MSSDFSSSNEENRAFLRESYEPTTNTGSRISRFVNLPNTKTFRTPTASLQPSDSPESSSLNGGSLASKFRGISLPESSLLPIQSTSSRLFPQSGAESAGDGTNYQFNTYTKESSTPQNNDSENPFSAIIENIDDSQHYDADRAAQEGLERDNLLANPSMEDIRLFKAILSLLPTSRLGGSSQFVDGVFQR